MRRFARERPQSAPRLPRVRASRLSRPACPPASPAWRHCPTAGLEGGQRHDVRRRLCIGDVGMAADSAGRGAGRVEQHCIEAFARARQGPRRPRPCSASSPSRVRFSASSANRVFERSTATTEAPACASCAVLPPGAAQRSATRLPATSPSSRAGSDAATSCTHHAPSSKPDSASMRPLGMEPHTPGREHAAESRSAHNSGSPFTVRSSGGSIRWASAMARARVLARIGDPARPQPVGRVDARHIERGGDGLALARDTAQYGIGEPVVALRP